MIDKHLVIQKLKDMAINLGRLPGRDEFLSEINMSRHHLTQQFGTWSVLLQAADLEIGGLKPKKIDNSIFIKDLNQHFESNEFVESKPIQKDIPTMCVISDIHWPFHHQPTLDKFHLFVKDHQPEVVIINGDAWDCYSHGKFPRSHNLFTPKQEQDSSRKFNEEFWELVQKNSPKSRCYQMLGNHDIRPLKRIIEEYPEAEEWVAEKLKSMFTFKNVTTIYDSREELIFGNVLIHHGYLSKLGAHRDYTLYNVIAGHTHRSGIVYRRMRDEILWEANCGYAGDPQSKGLSYTPQRITGWTHSFLYLDKYGPRIIT